MNRLRLFLSVSCLLCFAPLFYAQESESRPADDSLTEAPADGFIPLQADAPKSVAEDPLLSELTEMFLKAEESKREPSDDQGAAPKQALKPSSKKFYAAELLLKAARVLESDPSEVQNDDNLETVRQIRKLAVDLIR